MSLYPRPIYAWTFSLPIPPCLECGQLRASPASAVDTTLTLPVGVCRSSHGSQALALRGVQRRHRPRRPFPPATAALRMSERPRSSGKDDRSGRGGAVPRGPVETPPFPMGKQQPRHRRTGLSRFVLSASEVQRQPGARIAQDRASCSCRQADALSRAPRAGPSLSSRRPQTWWGAPASP